LKRDRTSAMTS